MLGGGPAGLMAAEVLARAGVAVTVYDRMPSLGRKLLMAGLSGLNLTHAEPYEALVRRYGAAAPRLRQALDGFSPDALRAWADGLGQETFVGSSGRVFPRAWKASPLLRAWLARLDGLGIHVRLRHRWVGFGADGALLFETPDGAVEAAADATVLAFGGASWPRLGSDGAWRESVAALGIGSEPFRPANCGLRVAWSEPMARFAGEPLKRVALAFGATSLRGETVVTAAGLEGGAVYPLASAIREVLATTGSAVLHVDLRPDLPVELLASRLARRAPKQSASTFLRKAAGLAPVAIGLLREAAGPALPTEPGTLAALMKAVPVRIRGTDTLERAISSAGGLPLDALDDTFMLRDHPGVFAAGEMLDWDAPTGGYLLQACLATGAAAGRGAAAWLAARASKPGRSG